MKDALAQLEEAFARLAGRPAMRISPGLVPDDPSFDNGPVINRLLQEQSYCSFGCRDVWWRTPVELTGELYGGGGHALHVGRRNIGVGRGIWNGEPGGTMIRHKSPGARMSQVTLSGGLGDRVASKGLELYCEDRRPSGQSVLDQVSFTNLEYGVFHSKEPVDWHTSAMTYYGIYFHAVEYPYWAENDQSSPVHIYKCEVRSGYKQAFTFKRGGGFHVHGMYLGAGDGTTLLWIQDRTQANNGTYEIHGLHVDGNSKNLTLVSHGEVAHRVRISGCANANGLAKPFVQARQPAKKVDIDIDLSGVRWPQ